ncbi:hypothetical protein BsWGS_07819 [Bradybaena similaris]
MGDTDYQTTCRRFLDTFANKIDTFSIEECETPFRLVTYQLVPSEVEGECLEWIRRYLTLNDCPPGLVSQLSRAVYKIFEDSVNLSQFYLEPDVRHNKSDEDDGDNVDDNHSESSSDDGHVDNSGPTQLDAGRLLQEVVSYVHLTVKSWSACPPVLLAQPSTLRVYSHAIKNTRRKMEDRHVLIPDLNILFDLKDNPNQSYFAVFDGHGGLEAAEYAATHLHGHLVSDQKFLTDPEVAMTQAYKTTDIKFLEKAKREGLRSGTTGVSVLIRETEMVVGWLGDSQALLVCSGQPVQIMNPHKPEREDERRRIEDLGGCVLFLGVWRVNGNISVSRAIGDAPFKPFVSSDADVTRIPFTGEEEYLILACDGLWDVLTPSEVTNIVYKYSKTSPTGNHNVAAELVNAARDSDSSDNISVVVIFFKSTLSTPKAAGAGSVVFGLSKVSENNSDKLDTSPSFSKSATLNAKLKPKANGKPQEKQKESASLCLASSCKNAHSISREAVLSSCSIDYCESGSSLLRQEHFLQKSVELDFVSVWRRLGSLLNKQIRSQNKQNQHQPSEASRQHGNGHISSTYSIPFSGISWTTLLQTVANLSSHDLCQKCKHKLKLEFLQGPGHTHLSTGALCSNIAVVYSLLCMYFSRPPVKFNSFCAPTFIGHSASAQENYFLGYNTAY